MGFKNNLLKLRVSAGYINAKEFAKKIGIPYSTYMGYENKNAWPPEENLKKIAKGLNVSIDTLLDYRVDERPPLERAMAIAKMLGVKADINDDGKVFISRVRNAKANVRLPEFDFITLVYAAYNKTNNEIEPGMMNRFCENFDSMTDVLIHSRLKKRFDVDDFEYYFPYRDYDSVPDEKEYMTWLFELATKPTATIFVGDFDKSALMELLRGDNDANK